MISSHAHFFSFTPIAGQTGTTHNPKNPARSAISTSTSYPPSTNVCTGPSFGSYAPPPVPHQLVFRHRHAITIPLGDSVTVAELLDRRCLRRYPAHNSDNWPNRTSNDHGITAPSSGPCCHHQLIPIEPTAAAKTSHTPCDRRRH